MISAVPAAAPRTWTLLYYLNGDNDLREHVSMDVVRLDLAGTSEQIGAVARLYRGSYAWSWKTAARKLREEVQPMPPALQTDWRGVRTFEVRGPAAPTHTLDQHGGRPSDWRELRDFLVESMRSHPSQRFMLVVGGHGAGANGLLTDGRGDRMAVGDFQRAVREAAQETGQKPAVILFESCSMGVPEMVNPLQAEGIEVLASPENVLMGRARHDQVLESLNRKPDMTPAELGQECLRLLSPDLPGLTAFPPA